MTYHVAFDISERFPDVVIGVVALVGWLAILIQALRPGWRQRLQRTSGYWAGVGGVLWAAFAIHNIGGMSGLEFGGVFAGMAFIVALLAWRNLDLPLRGGSRVPTRLLAPFLGFFLLLFTSEMGCHQLNSFDLSRRLAAGDATVVTGSVQGAYGYTWASQCFTVSGHKFCIDDSPSSLGFHQPANNGGPIHDGMQVRVSSIGDVIVRLEVADGQ